MVEVISDIDQILINDNINSLITHSETNQECNNRLEIICTVLQANVDSEISLFKTQNEKVEKIRALENFVNQSEDIEPFFIADMNVIRCQYQKWLKHLPRFTPFYAIKSNNNESILKTLNGLGTSFDCASMDEIRTILELGVSPEKIIFANPCKSLIHLKFACLKGVSKMTFDNEDELYKIKEHYPGAELVIRIDVDDSKSICQFGVKFGVRIGKTKALLELALKLSLKVIGVSFHVGSGCTDPSAYGDALKRARCVFDEGKELGLSFSLLDIGGGFPGVNGAQNGVHIEFHEIAEIINQTFNECFADIEDKLQLIAEPGRFFCSSAFTLVSNITSRRAVETEEEMSFMYYINDGVYGSFNCLIFDHAVISQPRCLIKNSNGVVSHQHTEELHDECHTCSIWGPTCDSIDCISKSIRLPRLSVGDWLIFDNMGAYTLVAASRFNGMNIPNVYYFDPIYSTIKATYITP